DLAAVARRTVPATVAGRGDYPWSLADAARRLAPASPFAYTGALENHPDLIATIAADRPVAGTGADAVRRLRDPVRLAAAARTAGLGFPETFHDGTGVPTDGTFLVKPLAGAGGRGIRVWHGPEPADSRDLSADRSTGKRPHQRPRIWQRLVRGAAISASYVMSCGEGRLFGVSRQLLGRRWCHAAGFTWCGAVVARGPEGPPWERRLHAPLTRLGDVLGEVYSPLGVVGVDLVLRPDHGLTVIEVNPRPTASMELFERLGAISVARAHLSACGLTAEGTVPGSPRASVAAPGGPAWAKAVLFAARPTLVSHTLVTTIASAAAPWTDSDGGWPSLADIPRPGQTIPVGLPVMTIFARGATPLRAVRSLRERTARLDALLAAAQPASLRGAASAAAWAATR
ncbi:MAG: ATP-grasp domain-containing protein, partial [Planctomycetia bacterium]